MLYLLEIVHLILDFVKFIWKVFEINLRFCKIVWESIQKLILTIIDIILLFDFFLEQHLVFLNYLRFT